MRVNLRKARLKAGLTQADVARMAGIGLRQYKAIEYGESNGSHFTRFAQEAQEGGQNEQFNTPKTKKTQDSRSTDRGKYRAVYPAGGVLHRGALRMAGSG